MKTVAVSIGESTLRRLKALAGRSGKAKHGQPRRAGARARPSVSGLVRIALRDYLDRTERMAREERERRIFTAHREILRRQAAALVGEQADP